MCNHYRQHNLTKKPGKKRIKNHSVITAMRDIYGNMKYDQESIRHQANSVERRENDKAWEWDDWSRCDKITEQYHWVPCQVCSGYFVRGFSHCVFAEYFMIDNPAFRWLARWFALRTQNWSINHHSADWRRKKSMTTQNRTWTGSLFSRTNESRTNNTIHSRAEPAVSQVAFNASSRSTHSKNIHYSYDDEWLV